MKTLVEKIKGQVLKWKWYLAIAGVAVVFVISSVFASSKSKRNDAVSKAVRKAIELKGEIVRDSIERSLSKVDDADAALEKLDQELQAIRDKQDERESARSSMTVREISESFKNLGY